MRVQWIVDPVDGNAGHTNAMALWRNGLWVITRSCIRRWLPGGSGCTRQRLVVTVKEQPNLGADDTATETGMAARQQSRSLPIGIIIRAVARCTPECCTRGRFGQPYWLRSATRRFGLRQLLLLKAAGRTQPLRVRLSIPQLRRSNVDIVLSGAGTAGVSRGGIAVSAVPYRPNGTLQFCSALG